MDNEKKISECAEPTQWAVRGWINECEGKGIIIIIREAYRSIADQWAAWYRYIEGEISRAAYPGASLHQKGLAVDIDIYKNGGKNSSKVLKEVSEIASHYCIYNPFPDDSFHFQLDKVPPPTPVNPPPAPTLAQLQNALRWASGTRANAITRAIKRLMGRLGGIYK